jgi:osmoprotectant transport system substrate-binding protein
MIKAGAATVGTSVLGSLSGCTGIISGDSSGGSVTAASMQWTEAELMGYLGFESLKANTDLTVNDELSLGGSQQVFQAVKSGEVGFYHLYTGGAFLTIPPQHTEVPSDPKAVYETAKKEMEEEHGLRYLQRANFNNTYALAARPEWQEKTGLKNISEFAEYVSGGNTDFTVVLGPEFAERSDGWPGLVDAYGFADAAEKLNIQKIGADLTYQTMGEGEADVGMVFTTNPNIQKYDLQVLPDDQNFFPPYNPAPLVNGDVLDENPAIEEPLNEPMSALDEEQTVIDLNAQITIEGKEVQTVAQDFLKNEGII